MKRSEAARDAAGKEKTSKMSFSSYSDRTF
jgi:hypothetical protein